MRGENRAVARSIGAETASGALAVETERRVQAARDKQMEAELERYMQHAIGHKPAGRMYATTLHSR
jgi:hypothetical protein